MSDKVRVRIAPSPTGKLHIGNARTGLFNFLYARRYGGTFILRIDDTDEERSTAESEQAIYDGLKWLGVTWDEGPDIGGPYPPYKQTERFQTYKDALGKMLEDGSAYYCFCPPDELDQKRQAAEKAHIIYRYDNACRSVTLEEARKRIANGERAVIRLRTPDNFDASFTDLIRGYIEVDSAAFDDFVIAKPGGAPLYNFATVIDDHLMYITHILRGQDHLTNTSKQILIYKALGYELPQFGHFSLILDTNRKKLSKRAGAVYIGDFQEQGYLPHAIANFIALIGWSPGDNREKMTMQEMIDSFSLDKVQKGDAIFDPEKLKWLNSVYIREMPLAQLVESVKPFLKKAGFDLSQYSEEWIEKVVALEQERIRVFSEAEELFDFFFKDLPYDVSLLLTKKRTEAEIANALIQTKESLEGIEDWTKDELENTCRALSVQMGWQPGDLFMPIRVAVTGKKATPPLFETMEVLGKSLSLNRIDKAVQLLKK